jgi:GT2 family glycosyltransferase
MVTAFDRIDQTVVTLDRIAGCRPAPAEILVHVDGGRQDCADAIRSACPVARVIISSGRVGPGGGRNRLMSEAAYDIVASFDDDSYPVDSDYFSRLLGVFSQQPGASVVAARIFHIGEGVGADNGPDEWVSDFNGCGCAYRREHFLDAGGYVPLVTAYGMEEVDLALRLSARGRRILLSPSLRVHHHTDRARHSDPAVTAASLANIVLLAFLRYPVVLWPVAAGQLLNRLQWLVRHGRRPGIGRGLSAAPLQALRLRHLRSPLRASAVWAYLARRRHPEPVR